MATLFVLKLFIVKSKNVSKQLYQIYNLLERIDSTFQDIRLLNEELILEAASLNDVWLKYYQDIPEDEFRRIVDVDPTSGDDKMGKYSKWLLALYRNRELPLEDLYKAYEYLCIFHKYKNKLDKKDIGQYKTLPELYQAIRPYEKGDQAASHKEELRQLKAGAKKVYEDDEWLVIVPETKDAAIEYGKGTKWCTAATGSYNYFDYYNNEGKLYININKKTGKKYQFHFESESFMDETDAPFNRSEANLSDNLIKFYKKLYGAKAICLKYNGIYDIQGVSNFVIVRNDEGLKNLLDKNENLVFDTWYRGIPDYPFTVIDDISFLIVSSNTIDACNILRLDDKNEKCSFLFEEWPNYLSLLDTTLTYGVVIVHSKQTQKATLFKFERDNAYFILDKWYNSIDRRMDQIPGIGKFYKVYNDERLFNFFDSEGNQFFDVWVNWVSSFENGIGIIGSRINGDSRKTTYFDENGHLIKKDTWFDVTGSFYCGFGLVGIKDSNGETKYNFIDKNGNYLSDEWFEDARGFSCETGTTYVQTKEGCALYNTNGEFITKPFADIDHYAYRMEPGEDFYIVSDIDQTKVAYNIINSKGECLVECGWVDDLKEGQYRTFIVKKDGRYNLVTYSHEDKIFKVVLKKWYDDIRHCYRGYTSGFYAKLGEKTYFISFTLKTIRLVKDV